MKQLLSGATESARFDCEVRLQGSLMRSDYAELRNKKGGDFSMILRNRPGNSG